MHVPGSSTRPWIHPHMPYETKDGRFVQPAACENHSPKLGCLSPPFLLRLFRYVSTIGQHSALKVTSVRFDPTGQYVMSSGTDVRYCVDCETSCTLSAAFCQGLVRLWTASVTNGVLPLQDSDAQVSVVTGGATATRIQNQKPVNFTLTCYGVKSLWRPAYTREKVWKNGLGCYNQGPQAWIREANRNSINTELNAACPLFCGQLLKRLEEISLATADLSKDQKVRCCALIGRTKGLHDLWCCSSINAALQSATRHEGDPVMRTYCF